MKLISKIIALTIIIFLWMTRHNKAE